MTIDKKEIVTKFGANENDTGNVAVQVALLTARISNLTEHLKANKKDEHSTRGLLKMTATRRKLMKYLKENDIEAYRDIKAKLGLR